MNPANHFRTSPVIPPNCGPAQLPMRSTPSPANLSLAEVTSSRPPTARRFLNFLAIACLWTGAGGQRSVVVADAPQSDLATAAGAQTRFATPDLAVTALQAAVQAKDKAALRGLFGPEVDSLLTGDPVQDENDARRFAVSMAEGCKVVKAGDDKLELEIGTNNWPLPIPLVRTDGGWRFDTAAGKEEIINRHIGKDELHAIGVCRAYVIAQQAYALANPRAGGGGKYARKFKSTAGRKDGLYWAVSGSEPASPFGPLVAEAHAEGYTARNGASPRPFHGYYFRILTRQGSSAPGGKMNYVVHGEMTAGFALLAYPEHWDRSGIMSFLVGQDGKVFERNLGENTASIAVALKEYNPGPDWTLVQDEGALSAAQER